MAPTFSRKVASVQRGAAIAAGLLGHTSDMAALLPVAVHRPTRFLSLLLR
jgi:hypothetical protein